MRGGSRRVSLIRDAIRIALAAIAALPESTEKQALHARALAHQLELERWDQVPPADEEREKLMKAVLALHVAVTKTRRRPAPGQP